MKRNNHKMGCCGCSYIGRVPPVDADITQNSAPRSKYRLGTITEEQVLGLLWDETQKRYVIPGSDALDKTSTDKA